MVSRRGQALVVAILALTVLTAAAISLSAAARTELRSAQRGIDRLRREAALRGAVNRGVALLDDARSDPQRLMQLLNSRHEIQWGVLSVEEEANVPTLEVALQIMDASARLNLNNATQENLKALGIDEDTGKAILAWRDEDEGDDDQDYADGPRPYNPKDRPYDSVEELLLVRGVQPSQFFGAPTMGETRALSTPPLSELLTAFSGSNNSDAMGEARLNVNKADPADLVSAAARAGVTVSDQQVRSLTQARDQQKKHYGTVVEAAKSANIEQANWGGLLDVWTADNRGFLPGRINVNTAPLGVLECVQGMTPQIARQVMEARRKKPEGLTWADLLKWVQSQGSQPASPPGGVRDSFYAPARGERRAPGTLQGQPPPQPNPQPDPGGQQGQGSQLSAQAVEQNLCVRSDAYIFRCLVRDPGSQKIDAAVALVHCPPTQDGKSQIVQWRQPDKYPGWTAWYRTALAEEGESANQRVR